MGSAVLKVLVLLLVIAYCTLFVFWNGQYVTVVGLDLWWGRYVQDMPLGFLALIGAVLGAVVMAIFVWGEWAQQKARADRAAGQVAQAKAKLQKLADIIKQHRQEIAQLKQQAPEEPSAAQAESEAGEQDAP